MVARFVFPSSLAEATRHATTQLVIVQHALIDTKPVAKLVGAETHRWLVELSRDVRPGDAGAVGSTLTGGKPRRLALGALPDRGSRYSSEADRKSVV